MRYERTIAYILIGIGVLALLTRLGGDSGWLWVAIVAAGFLAVYGRDRGYGFLVMGCVMAGVALGLLLEGAWGLHGTFLLSLGAGFYAIARVEPGRGRWPAYVAALLVALGLLVVLVGSGVLASAWFPLVLIVGGAYLLLRRNEEDAGQGGWVEAPPAEPSQQAPRAEQASGTETKVETAGGVQEGTRAAAAASQEVADMAEDEALPAAAAARLERLREWRTRQAATEEVSAYLVLNNDTLERIARDNPQTLQELDGVKGIGPVKLERYGRSLLEVLQGEVA
ncbi:MAG TPA: HRDC domain-containing protein [Trueperaceae bacterium]